MNPEAAKMEIGKVAPELTIETVELEGRGDFNIAYTVNGQWIFRFAWNAEGSRSQEQEHLILPELRPTVPLPIPDIKYYGYQAANGYAFVGYPKIEGAPLTSSTLGALAADEQERCAMEVAAFLRTLHSFDTSRARQLGIVECGYPFCRTEEGISQGTIEEQYKSTLQSLVSYPLVDGKLQKGLVSVMDELLYAEEEPVLQPALVHGDLSYEHVLYDGQTGKLTGIIDFTDVVVTSPILDFVYLYHSYGSNFLYNLVDAYGKPGMIRILGYTRMLHLWYAALRLLWMLDHGYKDGAQARLAELNHYMSLRA